MQEFRHDPGQHATPPLPYAENALEPIISAQALRTHYAISKSYADNLNKTELAIAADMANNDFAHIKQQMRDLAFYGSGDILHAIYFSCMASQRTPSAPAFQTNTLIGYAFGSMSQFKTLFSQAAIQVQGPGWAVLAWQPAYGKLRVLTAERHENLTEWGAIPILLLDVWEHAYFLDYKQNRKEYVDAWWNLVNWDMVEKRLVLALQGIIELF